MEHTHIATDSANALLWQIRNSILYPQRIKRQIHAKLLEIGVHHIQEVKRHTMHLYKVKAHADILGNECADAKAKCSARIQSGPDATHPSSGQQGWWTLLQPANEKLFTPTDLYLQQKDSPTKTQIVCTLLVYPSNSIGMD